MCTNFCIIKKYVFIKHLTRGSAFGRNIPRLSHSQVNIQIMTRTKHTKESLGRGKNLVKRTRTNGTHGPSAVDGPDLKRHKN